MSGEVYALAATTLCGAGAVMLFDMMRAVRCQVKQNRALVFCEDLLFWIICIVAVWKCLWHFNDGEIRFFEAAGFAIGALLYFLVLGELFFVIFKVIFKNIFKIVKLIFQILLTPPRFLYKILLVPLYSKIRVGKNKRKENSNE